MTTINHDPHVGVANTLAEVGEMPDRGRFEITTTLKDGVTADRTSISDLFRAAPAGLRGGIATARLRDLAAALIEHADAIDLYRSSYREAEFASPAPKPVEVFPGFPLTMTEREHVEGLGWPIGVRARDRDGDVWQRLSFGWRFVNPQFDKPNPDDPARLRNNLPATIIPTSWPTPAAETNTES